MASGFRVARAQALLAMALLGGLPVSGGCSFVFVQPARAEGDVVVAGDCTSNLAAPVVDTALASTNLMSALYVANQDHVSKKDEAAAVGLIATSFWLSSAIYGYYFTGECKNLREVPVEPSFRRVRTRRTVLSGPPAPPVPAAAAEPAVPPAPPDAAPVGPPAVRQHSDADDPGRDGRSKSPASE